MNSALAKTQVLGFQETVVVQIEDRVNSIRGNESKHAQGS